MMVPIMVPHLVTPAEVLMPRRLSSVAAQYTHSTMISMYHLLAARASSQRWLGPMNARDTAAKVSTVGNQMVLSIH